MRTAPRRGAIEHYYKAVTRPFFSDHDWTKLPRSARHAISDRTLESIWTDVAGAMEDGSFEARADRHLSRTALLLDEQAWEELNEILKGVLEDALRLETESANRRAESGEEGINTKLALMHFETTTRRRQLDARRSRPAARRGPRSRPSFRSGPPAAPASRFMPRSRAAAAAAGVVGRPIRRQLDVDLLQRRDLAVARAACRARP